MSFESGENFRGKPGGFLFVDPQVFPQVIFDIGSVETGIVGGFVVEGLFRRRHQVISGAACEHPDPDRVDGAEPGRVRIIADRGPKKAGPANGYRSDLFDTFRNQAVTGKRVIGTDVTRSVDTVRGEDGV